MSSRRRVDRRSSGSRGSSSRGTGRSERSPEKRSAKGATSYRVTRREMRGRRIRRETLYWAGAALLAAVLVFGAYSLGASTWRTAAGWWEARQAGRAATGENKPVNLVIIGVEKAKSQKVAQALGLVQVVPAEKKVRGVTFSGDTFVQIPGQGFERAAEALRDGPEQAVATVENLLGVPVENYVMLDMADYKALTEKGRAAALFEEPVKTDLPAEERSRLSRVAAAVPAGDALMVPMPVKTIAVGDDVFFEPQKAQIADVLKSWWGVEQSAEQPVIRIKILNGVGTPGIAGVAARGLIKAGYRVVDTTNAKTFGYKKTKITNYRASKDQVGEIRKLLGVGVIEEADTAQDVVDVIILIGKDYKPPKK